MKKNKQVAILTDTTRCNGCEECVKACKGEKNLDRDRLWPWQNEIDELSSSRFTTIIRRPGNKFVRQHCRHCLEPACVSVCPVGALQKRPTGAIYYDASRCMGCRYCMLACPFGLPRYRWQDPVPLISKCDLCYQRTEAGKEPACVAACPQGATIFGPRNKLISLAKRRLLREPRKYKKRIFGESEYGGTGVLYISDLDLDFLCHQPRPVNQPLPELTWAALKKVPLTILGMGGLMTGLYWLIGRRMKLAAGEEKTATPEARGGGKKE